jgi:chromosomal replication initiator protein
MDEFPFGHFLKTEPKQPTRVETNRDIELRRHSSNQSINQEYLLIDQEIHSGLQQAVPKEKYDAFFANALTLFQIRENELIFNASTQFLKKLIEEYYIETLVNISRELLGNQYRISIQLTERHTELHEQSKAKSPQVQSKPILHKEMIVEDHNNKIEKHVIPDDYHIKKGKTVRDTSFSIEDFTPNNEEILETAQSNVINHLENIGTGQSIDTRKTFNSFIVGPSNNLAHASAIAVSKNPGKIYSSLYVYGNSGLGKTHLLHAVANQISDHIPGQRIFITTANEFMSEMIKAIQLQNIQSFRKKYSEMVDVLMIDDIHELKNRPGTQNEFFHVFNELERRKKQLIFTSDKEPKEINGIEDRIKTRLSSALVVEIQQPDLETRIAILKKKAIEEDIYIPDDVVNLIASCIKKNIRELEGSLIKLGAYSSIFNVDIDVEIAREQLKISSEDLEKTVNMETITKSVSNYFKIPVPDIRSKSRAKEITFARHIAMYFSYYLGKSTLIEIGDYFGKRDHTSVMHGINKIKQLQKNDQNLSQLLYDIEAKI